MVSDPSDNLLLPTNHSCVNIIFAWSCLRSKSLKNIIIITYIVWGSNKFINNKLFKTYLDHLVDVGVTSVLLILKYSNMFKLVNILLKQICSENLRIKVIKSVSLLMSLLYGGVDYYGIRVSWLKLNIR